MKRIVFFLATIIGLALGAAPAYALAASFNYTFNAPGLLQETGSMSGSSSPYFWINSGGKLVIGSSGIGSTAEGGQNLGDIWRTLYALTNPLDTDTGIHPQNLFRLVTKSSWQSVSEQALFRIDRDNFSSSPNRQGYNGLLLMSRYHMDGQTLYYAGIRTDGTAVIKKKLDGVYTTLAQKQVFSGTYNRDTNPNLLPHHTWIGLKSETINNSDGSVTVNLYMDNGNTGSWTLMLSTRDNGIGGRAITEAGYGGIRTDFMDVSFDNYKLSSL